MTNYTVKQIFDFKRRRSSPFCEEVAYLPLDREKEVKWMATLYKSESVFNVSREQSSSLDPPGDGWLPPSWAGINYRDAYKLIVVVKKIVEESDSYLEYKLTELFGEEDEKWRNRGRLDRPGTLRIESKRNIHYQNGSKWVRLMPSEWVGRRIEY